jgi:hypothetical protein
MSLIIVIGSEFEGHSCLPSFEHVVMSFLSNVWSLRGGQPKSGLGENMGHSGPVSSDKFDDHVLTVRSLESTTINGPIPDSGALTFEEGWPTVSMFTV